MATLPLMTCGCRAQGTTTAQLTATDRAGESRPVCIIHGVTTVAPEPADLATRTARCSCGKTRPSDSTGLAFFEYRGPGSPAATERCKTCRYAEVAHHPRRCTRCDGRGVYGTPPYAVPCTRCDGNGTTAPAAFMRGAGGHGEHDFQPHGAWDHDIFYCGCRGWD